MKSLMDDVAAFHRQCGQPVLDEPVYVAPERITLRYDLHAEEFEELCEAMENLGSTAECHETSRVALELVADGIADLIYVLVGTALELGIPLDRVWAEVQRSNMTKLGDHKSSTGKILKGPEFSPPDIARAIWGDDRG